MNGRVNTKSVIYKRAKQSHQIYNYHTVLVRLLSNLNEVCDNLVLLGRRQGGRWHVKGSKQVTKVAGKRELRTTDEILRLRKKAAQNKNKQMSKGARAKRRQHQSLSSHQPKTRTGKKRKR